MKAVVVITDSEAVQQFEKTCLTNPSRGFTVIPQALGRGRSGLHTGDRIHPGGESILFTVVPDAELEATLAALRSARDLAGVAEVTRIFVSEVQEVR